MQGINQTSLITYCYFEPMGILKTSGNYQKEREAVLLVALVLNQRGYIFRETGNADVGIDGQIEEVNSLGEPTGKIVAAQIKSGDSYLTDKGDHFAFYPHDKHRNYWSSFALPVILFVHSPSDDKTYFTDARYQLNVPGRAEKYISLSKNMYLTKDSASMLFTPSDNGLPHYSLDQLFEVMVRTVCPNPTFNISYLDLFCQGLTNLCRHLYFSMDLAIAIAEYNNTTEYGLGIGYEEHEFLHAYVNFLLSQNLAGIDYSDYLIDWTERKLQPTFIAPITNRGHQLLAYISQIEKEHEKELVPSTLVRERYINMTFYSQDDYLRLELAKQLRAIFMNKK